MQINEDTWNFFQNMVWDFFNIEAEQNRSFKIYSTE